MATATRTKPVDLDAMTPEERAALREQLNADAAGITADQIAAARAKNGRLRALMHDRDHLRDCPVGTDADDGDIGRVEAWKDTRPPRPQQGIPAKPVTVVRCVECGGATVIEEPFDAVMARVDRDTDIDA